MSKDDTVNITPGENYILVLPLKDEAPTQGDFVTADNPNPNQAKIISVDDFYNERAYKAGDIVYVKDYIDKPLKKNGKTYYFVKYEDVLGKENDN